MTFKGRFYIINLAVDEIEKQQSTYGVWLSLARALDLGSRGRRFESCHPDVSTSALDARAGVVQW